MERESRTQALAPPDSHSWLAVKDGDPRARWLFGRHYSARRSRPTGTAKFVGPGEYICLITPDCGSMFVWRLFREVGQEQPRGVNCAVFRRENGSWLASDMILAAETHARARWPGENRLYTYVNPERVRSPNPGYCFKMAGWKQSRITPGGLLELEKENGPGAR